MSFHLTTACRRKLVMANKTNEYSIVRDCGPSERMFTAWHELGLYFRVSNTATLRIPRAKLSNGSVSHLIRTAVAQVMLKQPAMRVGIIGEDSKRPQLVALPSIDLSQQVEDAQAASFDDVAKSLEKLLMQPWPELSKRPGWYVRVFNEPESAEGEFYRVRVCLTVHHAISDGISTAMFQKYLIEALNSPDPAVVLMVDKSPFIELTDDLSDYPPSQDKLMKFTADINWMLSNLWNYSVPQIFKPFSPDKWAGGPYDPNIKAVHLRHLVITSTTTRTIVEKCREKETTITSLLNALCIVSFARRAPTTTRHGFENSTSISLRPWISEGVPFDKSHMCLSATGYNQEYGPDILAKARHGRDNDVWELAVQFRRDMKQKTDVMPHNDFSYLVPYIGNFRQACEARYGKPRRELWGLSNLGLIAGPSEKGPWELENIMFAQIYPLISSALAVNVATVDGGDMIISLVWQDGVLETGFVEDSRHDLERWLMKLGQDGSLGV